MAIDFAGMKKSALTHNPKLFAILLGQSGAGKSFVIGTVGVPTLYIHASGEAHGVDSARVAGGDITPFCMDIDDKGTVLSPDAALERLSACLSDPGIIKNFGAVALDGWAELEDTIRSSVQFRERCKTEKTGKHSVWEEPSATKSMNKDILTQLMALHRAGLHIITTGILNVREADPETGAITLAEPRMKGLGVCEDLIRQFGDVLPIGRMEGVRDGNKVIKHKFQFGSEVVKNSKDLQGTLIRSTNFNPRISGTRFEDLPAYAEADLSKIIALKLKAGVK